MLLLGVHLKFPFYEGSAENILLCSWKLITLNKTNGIFRK